MNFLTKLFAHRGPAKAAESKEENQGHPCRTRSEDNATPTTEKRSKSDIAFICLNTAMMAGLIRLAYTRYMEESNRLASGQLPALDAFFSGTYVISTYIILAALPFSVFLAYKLASMNR